MVEYLKKIGFIKDKRIEKAFLKVDRKDFIVDEFLNAAYVDEPLPIGYGQTTSQPSIIALMVHLLDPKEGEKILEVGTGLGYQTAILAELIGLNGKVVSIERVPELYKEAKKRLEKYKYKNIDLILGDGSKGYPKEAPYDGIIVSCCCPSIPIPLIQQLKVGGRIVLPVGPDIVMQRLIKIIKEKRGLKEEFIEYVSFVPLVGEYGFKSF